MLLEIEERQLYPDITHIVLTGRLTLGRESQRLEDLMAELADNSIRKVILDLANVTYIDSSGIGIVVMSSGRIKEAGGHMAVVVTEGRVLKLLQTAGVPYLCRISETVEQAAASFASTAATSA
jgi:anti-anti-sigma factor